MHVKRVSNAASYAYFFIKLKKEIAEKWIFITVLKGLQTVIVVRKCQYYCLWGQRSIVTST